MAAGSCRVVAGVSVYVFVSFCLSLVKTLVMALSAHPDFIQDALNSRPFITAARGFFQVRLHSQVPGTGADVFGGRVFLLSREAALDVELAISPRNFAFSEWEMVSHPQPRAGG